MARIFWVISMFFLTAGLKAEAKFEEHKKALSSLSFTDNFTDSNWQDNWFLDGEKAKVTNDKEGLTLDPEKGFAVLWTKEEFKGDVKIEYDFKRLDELNWGVNIIYIQAQGDGENGCTKDISQWSEKRKTAAMNNYFMNMDTYHISYAAYTNGGKDKGKEYVRARRYLPLKNKGLTNTELSGEAGKTGIFDDKQWVHVTIVKKAKEIWAEFKHPEKTVLCHFKNIDKEGIEEGRIGLRIMPGRKSMFKNFKVFQLKGK